LSFPLLSGVEESTNFPKTHGYVSSFSCVSTQMVEPIVALAARSRPALSMSDRSTRSRLVVGSLLRSIFISVGRPTYAVCCVRTRDASINCPARIAPVASSTSRGDGSGHANVDEFVQLCAPDQRLEVLKTGSRARLTDPVPLYGMNLKNRR